MNIKDMAADDSAVDATAGLPLANYAFPIVAVGASAGGLEAFRSFLDVQPHDSGMAFVLIQHLDPDHPSLMAELLSSHTSMPIAQASDGMSLQPDHVYLIPPGVSLTLKTGCLRLSKPAQRHGARLPFDFFLGSLARECGAGAVCVVLSGSGSDGAVGVRAIRDHGGLVVAQDPEEAEFDGMPRSAIASGVVDLICSIPDIPHAIFQRFHLNLPAPNPAGTGELQKIVALLKNKVGTDFSAYKLGTLQRRLEHRMAAARVTDHNAYRELVREKPGEAELLRKDLLIGVTQFFRGKPAFDCLSREILPDLVKHRRDGRPIRVWCPGCSTGEEPYSIAMLLLETLAASTQAVKFQIFATDVNADSVAFARDGLYPEAIEADVPPDRLAKFFSRQDHHYSIASELRDAVVFTVHDLLADPPFSNIDLVCCRNLLIYLQPEAQQKILSFFHFALRDGGVLFLGSSETIGSGSRYEAISRRYRIYRHIGRSRPGEVAFPIGIGNHPTTPALSRPTSEPEGDFDRLSQQIVFETLSLGSVLVDARNESLHFSGQTDKYLKVASGAANNDLLAMARDGLRPKLRAALEWARRDRSRTIVRDARLESDRGSVSVTIIVEPFEARDQPLCLVTFLDGAPTSGASQAPLPSIPDVPAHDRAQELAVVRQELENAILDLDRAKEEQKRITEQAMSLNEEAQSTNEELVTSKEELQSVNEELTALNGQLHETLERQRNTSNDLQNILDSSGIATIFLDENLEIRFFTPAAMALFRVISSDIGRPLADFTSLANDDDLMRDAEIVLTEQSHIEKEVSTLTGDHYSRLILPYRTHDGLVEGVVITYTNITERTRAADALAAAKQTADLANAAKSRFLAAASHDLRQPLQTIRLLRGLLFQMAKDKQARDLLDRLDATVGVMSGMLNTLLDINQLEAGVIHADTENFPLDEVFRRLDTDFGYHMRAKGLQWRVVSCRQRVRSDPRLLEQILRNLLSNAVKFTSSGRVLLGARRCGASMRIEVRDTGPGILENDRQAIFEEFRQMDNPARERSKGLGLGLAIVQRLAGLLGHAIELESDPGRGSMFSITVPMAAAEGPVGAIAEISRVVDVKPRRASVLVVEDDPTIRELLELLLRSADYKEFGACDGFQALASTECPDLVVADYNLPNGPNGVEAIEKLREKFNAPIPAIVLTGDISIYTLQDIADHDCIHLDKPVEADELLRLVARLLAPAAPIIASTETRDDVSATTVFVVDDDDGLRRAARDILEAQGWKVEAYASCESFLEARLGGGSRCLVIDAILPGMNGFELLEVLRARHIDIPSIMITGQGDIAMAVKAMKAGARDFLEKPFGHEELVASIVQALGRDSHDDLSTAKDAAVADALVGLTKRQRQILDLVIAGHPSKNIAADLGISQRTVENHRAAIMRKTGSRSIPGLVRFVISAS